MRAICYLDPCALSTHACARTLCSVFFRFQHIACLMCPMTHDVCVGSIFFIDDANSTACSPWLTRQRRRRRARRDPACLLCPVSATTTTHATISPARRAARPATTASVSKYGRRRLRHDPVLPPHHAHEAAVDFKNIGPMDLCLHLPLIIGLTKCMHGHRLAATRCGGR